MKEFKKDLILLDKEDLINIIVSNKANMVHMKNRYWDAKAEIKLLKKKLEMYVKRLKYREEQISRNKLGYQRLGVKGKNSAIPSRRRNNIAKYNKIKKNV